MAVSDADASIASPLAIVEATGDDAASVRRLVQHVADHDIDEFVIGLPLNMDGSEGPQAKRTRAFGKVLAAQTGKPVHYWDERLSSHGADEFLSQMQMTHKKKKARRDAIAASIILQSFLDARKNVDGG